MAGSATIAAGAHSTTITASNNTLLKWGSFDIPVGDTVRFVQPGSTARVMNWIGGLAPTQINGSLLANGQVYLLNPNGVFFGQTAVVDAGHLYAVGGSMSKDDFLAGLNRFSGLTGTVSNAGSIRGDVVALVGRSVINTGTIVSPNGFVGLVAGNQVLLGQDGSSIYVDTGATGLKPADTATTGVTNHGTIDAGKGTAVLAAGDFYAIAITHDGKLSAANAKLQGQGSGDVLVSGAIDASSASGRGGSITVTGDRVGLLTGANLDASGATGGGTILVGGDTHGGNPDVRNASRTVVQDGAQLAADAILSGDGGKVVVWSNDWTGYDGAISARGAGLGNGGFSEVSGHALDFAGKVDLGAPAGLAGTLLLDPRDLTIDDGTSDHPAGDGSSGTPFAPQAGANGGTLNWSTIFGALATANVFVDTTGTGTLSPGDITIAESPNAHGHSGAYNFSHDLTLTTDTAGQISISSGASVSNAGTGSITFNAGTGGITIGAGLATHGGNITLGTTGDITISAAVDASKTASAGNAGTGGTISITANSGTVTVDTNGSIHSDGVGGTGAADTAGATGTGGPITISATNIALQGNAAITSNGTGGLGGTGSANDPGNVGGAGGAGTGGHIIITAGTNLSVASGASVTSQGNGGAGGTGGAGVTAGQAGGAGGAGGTSAGGKVDVTIATGSINGTIASFTGNPALGGAGGAGAGAGATGATGATGSTIFDNVTLNNSGAVTSSGGTVKGTLVLQGAGDVASSGSRLQFWGTTLSFGKSGASSAFITGINAASTNISGTGTGTSNLDVSSANNLAVAGALVVPGNFTLRSQGTVTFNANVTAGSVLALSGTTGTGNLSFGAGVTIKSDSQQYQAGDGGGTANTTAVADLTTNTPSFLKNDGTAGIPSFLYRQDASIGDGSFPSATQFGGTPPTSFYSVISFDGSITLNTGSKVAGSTLGLSALTDVTFGGSLSVTGLSASGVNIAFGANTLNAGVGAVTFSNSGTVTGTGLITANTLALIGSGNSGPLNTKISTFHVATTGGATSTITNTLDGGVAVFGSAAGNNAAVSVTSRNTANSADDAITVNSSNLDLSSGTGTSVSLTGGALTLTGTVTSAAVTLANSGTASNTGLLTASTQLNLNGSGTVTLTTATPSIAFNTTGGNVTVTNDRTNGVTLSGAAGGTGIAVSVTSKNTAGAADDAITIGGGATFDASGAGNSVSLTGSALTLTQGIFSPTITLTNSGNVTGTGTLHASTGLNVNGTGNFGATGAGAINTNTPALAINKSSGSVYDSNGSNTLAVTPTAFSGAGEFTAGPFSITSGLNLGSNPLTINASTVGFGANTVTAGTISVTNSGAFTGTGLITASTQLNLSGSASVGALSIATPSVVLGTTGGDVTLNSKRDTGLTLSGTAGGNGVTLTVASRNTANSADDAITVNGSGALDVSGTGSAVSLTGSTLQLTKGITSPTITLTNSGNVTGTGALVASTGLNISGTGNFGATGSGAINTNTPALAINKASGSVYDNNGSNLLAVTPTAFSGAGEFTSGAFSISGALALGSNPLTIVASTVGFGANAVTAGTISVTNSAAFTGTGLVTASTQLNLLGSGSVGPLTTATPSVSFNTTGGSVTLTNQRTGGVTLSGAAGGTGVTVAVTSKNTGGVTNDAVTIGGGSVFDATGAGNSVSLTGTTFTLTQGISSPTIALNTGGDITGSGTLTAATGLSLIGTGNVGATGAGAINTNTPSLTLNKASGDVFVNNGSNALGLTPTAFSGTGEFTSAAFTLSGSLNAGVNPLTFTTTSFGLGANNLTGGIVSITNSGALTGSGLITASTQLNLSGTGNVTATTSTPILSLAKTGGGDATITNTLDGGLSVSGTAAGNGAAVSLTSRNTANNADDALTVTAGNLSATGTGSSIALAGGNVTLTGNVTSPTISLTNSGTLVTSGTLIASTQVTLAGSGDASVVTSTPVLILNKIGGADAAVTNTLDAGLTVSGTAAGASAAVAVISKNTANTADAALTVGSANLQAVGAGSSISLTSGTLALTGAITAPVVSLTNSGAAAGSGTITATTGLTLNGAGAVGATGAGAINTNTPALAVVKSAGGVFINNGSNALALTPTTFVGGGEFTAGNFTLTGPVNVGSNPLTLTTALLDLGSNPLTGGAVTLANSAALTNSGLVTASSLNLNAAGDVASLLTATPTLALGKTGGNVGVTNLLDGGIAVSGTDSGAPVAVSITSRNSANSAFDALTVGAGGLVANGNGSSITLIGAPVTATGNVTANGTSGSVLIVGGDLLLNGSVTATGTSGSVALNGANVSLNAAVTSPTVSLNNSSAATGTGLVTASTGLTLSGVGTVGATGAGAISIATPQLTLNKAIGSVFVNDGSNALTLTPTLFTGSGEFTSGNFTLGGSLSVGGNSLTFTTGSFAFAANNITAGNLSFSNTGNLTGTGLVRAFTQATFNGSGNVGPLNLSTTVLNLATAGGADFTATNFLDTGVLVSGTAAGNNAAVAITSRNTADTADAALAIGGSNLVANGTGSSVSLTTGTLSLVGGITSPTITLTNSGAVSGTGVLTASTQLNLDGAGDAASLATATPVLSLNTTSGADVGIFNESNGGLTVTGAAAGSNAAVSIISRNGTNSADAALTIGAGGLDASGSASSVSLSGAAITLTGGVISPTISLTSTGGVSGAGVLTAATQINLAGSGTVNGIVTVTPVIGLTMVGGASVSLTNEKTTGLSISGSAAGNGAAVSIASRDDTNSADAALTVSGPLSASGTGSSITLVGGQMNLNAPVTSPTIALTNSGTLSTTGLISASTQLTLGGTGDSGTLASSLSIATPLLILNKSNGADVWARNKLNGGLTVQGAAAGNNAVVSVISRDGGDANPDTLTVGAPGILANGTGSAVSLSGSSMTLTGSVTSPALVVANTGLLSGAGTLTAGISLSFTNGGDIGSGGSPIATVTPLINLNKANGNIFINNGANALTLTPTALAGTAQFTSGAFTLGAALNDAGNPVTFNTTSLGLGTNAVTGSAIIFNNSGALTGSGFVTAGTQINFTGSGNVGAAGPGNALNTSAPALNLTTTGGASVFLTNKLNGGATLGGSAAGNGAVVSIASRNSADTADDALTITGANLAAGGTGSSIALAAGALTLTGSVTSPVVSLTNSGLASGSGVVTASSGLTLAGAGQVGPSAASAIVISTPSLTLNKAAGAVFVNDGSNALTLTPTAFTGGGDFISGALTIAGPVNVGANALTFHTTTLGFGANNITGGALAFDTSGALTGTGIVTASTGLTLSNTGAVGSTGAGAILTVTPTLTLNKGAAGGVFINNGANSLTLVPNAFVAGGEFTAGTFTLNGSINVGSNPLTFTTGLTALGANAVTGGLVTFTNSAPLSGTGLITASTLNLNGSGDVLSLSTATPTLVLAKTAGNVTVTNKLNGGLTSLSGTDSGSPAALSITSRNSADTAFDALTIAAGGLVANGNGSSIILTGAPVTATGNVTANGTGGSVSINGGALTLNGNVTATGASGSLALTGTTMGLNGVLTSPTISLTNSGAASGAGAVTASTGLTLAGTGTVGSTGAGAINTVTPQLTLNKGTSGGVFINNGANALTLTPTQFVGGGEFTSGNFTLNGPLNVGGNNLLFNTGTATLGANAIIAANLTFNNSGALTGSGLLTVASTLTLQGAGAVGSAGARIPTNLGTLVLNKSAGDVFLSEANAIVLAGTTPAGLDLTAGGPVTDNNLAVGTALAVNAGTNPITLGTTTTDNFGSLTLTGGAVNVREASSMAVTSANATSLSLTTTSGGIDVTAASVTNAFNLSSAGTTHLGTVSAGSLASTSTGAFDVDTATVTNLLGVTAGGAANFGAVSAGSLTTNASGAITDDGNLTVTGAANFDANGNAILLGDTTTANFGSLTLAGSSVNVREASDMHVLNATASDLTLTSTGGAVTVDNAAVANAMSVTAAGAANLGAISAQSLTVNAGGGFDVNSATIANAVSVTAGGPANFGQTSAASLTVNAGGAITDDGNLTIAGLANFNSGANAITLGDTTAANFGSLTFAGGNVNIKEASTMLLTGSNTAGALTLSATRAVTDSPTIDVITNAPGMSLFVPGQTMLDADSITLGGTTTPATINLVDPAYSGHPTDYPFPNLVLGLNTNTVNVTANSFIRIRSLNVDPLYPNAPPLSLLQLDAQGVDLAGIKASILHIVSHGPEGITDSIPTNVIGDATFDANGANIILDQTQNDFNTITLSGDTVVLTDANAVALDSVLASGPFTATAATTLVVDHALIGSSSITLTASNGGVTVNEAVRAGLTGGDVKITAATDITVGNSVSAPAGSVTISAGHGATFTAGQDVKGAFTVNAGVGGVNFQAGLDGANGDVTINTAGPTRFGVPIGATTPLHSLTTDAGGTTYVDGGAVSVSNQTGALMNFGDQVVLTSNAAFNGAAAIFGAGLRGNTSGGQNLTLNIAGNATLGGPVGTAGFELGTITTGTSGATLINGGSVSTIGAQTYNNTVLLGADATLTAGNAGNASPITFNSTVDTGTAGQSHILGVTASAAATGTGLSVNAFGSTTFNAAVGKTSRLGTFATSTNGTTAIKSDFFAGEIDLNNNLTVGGSAALAVDTSGTQTYAGTVSIAGGVTFNSAYALPDIRTPILHPEVPTGIEFRKAVDGAGRILKVSAPNAAVVADADLGSAASPLDSVAINSRVIMVGGDVWTTKNIALDIGATPGSTDPSVDPTNDYLRFFNATAKTTTTLNSVSGEIILGTGAVTGTAKTGAPLRASIYKNDTGDLNLFAAKITVQPFERLAVRDGSLYIIADGTDAADTLTLSSTAASKNLVVVSSGAFTAGSPSIIIRARDKATQAVVKESAASPSTLPTISSETTTKDQGTELVAGGVFFFHSLTGVDVPTRATATAFNYITIPGNISLFPNLTASIGVLQPSPSTIFQVAIADAVGDNSNSRPALSAMALYFNYNSSDHVTTKDGVGVIDPNAFGPVASIPQPSVLSGGSSRSPNSPPTSGIVPLGEHESAPPEPDLSTAVREQLQALGIYARPLSPEERLTREHGAGMFVTIPPKDRPRESDYQVADARVQDRAVREVLRSAEETGLLGDDRGKLEPIARALAASFEAFSAANPNGDADQFRAWLESNNSPDAVKVITYLKALRDTLRRIELLGLTEKEMEGSKAQIFGSVLRSKLNVEPEFLQKLVDGLPAGTQMTQSTKGKPGKAGPLGIVAEPEASPSHP